MAIEKETIIESAKKSFSLFGYKATTMEQIAKIANISKASIYTVFTSKEELFEEIMRSVLFEIKTVVEATIDPHRPFFENLNDILYRLADFRKKHELMIKLSQEIKEMGTPAARKAMITVEDAIVSFIREQIKSAVENKRIKQCDPEITAFVIYKLYIALVFDWEKRHPALNSEEISNLFQLYFVKGLAAEER
jgi:AcrR family transcriptional regulator